jgi:hypothetical protein
MMLAEQICFINADWNMGVNVDEWRAAQFGCSEGISPPRGPRLPRNGKAKLKAGVAA